MFPRAGGLVPSAGRGRRKAGNATTRKARGMSYALATVCFLGASPCSRPVAIRGRKAPGVAIDP